MTLSQTDSDTYSGLANRVSAALEQFNLEATAQSTQSEAAAASAEDAKSVSDNDTKRLQKVSLFLNEDEAEYLLDGMDGGPDAPAVRATLSKFLNELRAKG